MTLRTGNVDRKIIREMKREEVLICIISMAMHVDMRCQAEWFEVYGSRALDHFGRITEAKVLTQDNAWRKRS